MTGEIEKKKCTRIARCTKVMNGTFNCRLWFINQRCYSEGSKLRIAKDLLKSCGITNG